jgi:hypothetical protein
LASTRKLTIVNHSTRTHIQCVSIKIIIIIIIKKKLAVVESTKTLHYQMQMKTAITMDEGVAMPHPIYKYWLFFSFCFRLMTKTKIKNVKINFGKKGRNLFVCWFLRLMAEKMIANRFDCVTHTSSLEDLSSRWPLGVEACAKKKKKKKSG